MIRLASIHVISHTVILHAMGTASLAYNPLGRMEKHD